MRRAAVMAAGAALMLPGAGCRDDAPSAKERYRRDVRAVLLSIRPEMRRLENMRVIADSGPGGAGLAYVRFRRATLAMVGRLARLKPPPDARAAQALAVDGLRRSVNGWYRRAFRVLALRGDKAATAVLTHPNRRELRALLEIRRAHEILATRGYTPAGSGGLP